MRDKLHKCNHAEVVRKHPLVYPWFLFGSYNSLCYMIVTICTHMSYTGSYNKHQCFIFNKCSLKCSMQVELTIAMSGDRTQFKQTPPDTATVQTLICVAFKLKIGRFYIIAFLEIKLHIFHFNIGCIIYVIRLKSITMLLIYCMDIEWQ